jgi:hypothetical protein
MATTDRAKRYKANRDEVLPIKAGDCVGFCSHISFDFCRLAENGVPLIANDEMKGEWQAWGGIDCEVIAQGGAVVTFRWIFLCPECHTEAKRLGGNTQMATKVATWYGPPPPIVRLQ